MRGLTGSARGYLASWLQRETGRTLLYVVAHGDAYEEARDDLEYFRGPGATLALPEPDTLPYDPSSPHPGITAQRLETLAAARPAGESGRRAGHRARRAAEGAAAGAAARAACSSCRWAATTTPARSWSAWSSWATSACRRWRRSGSSRGAAASSTSTPAGCADPLRLEFDGDTLVSLRRFDASTQRSLEQLPAARVLPRYEVVIEPGEAAAVSERLRGGAATERGPGATAATPEAPRRATGSSTTGMERFAAHYDPDLGTLFDYLPADAVVVLDDPGGLRARAADLDELVARGYAEARGPYPSVSPPGSLFLPGADFDALVSARPGADWLGPVGEAGRRRALRRHADGGLRARPSRCSARSSGCAATSPSWAPTASSPWCCATTRASATGSPSCWARPARRSAWGWSRRASPCAAAGLAVLTDHEIFARYRRRRRRLKRTGGLSLAELSALKPGDYVVHEDHGIGVYRGMQRLTLNGQETDCLEIDYAERDRLFVPVEQLALVSRYAAGEGARPVAAPPRLARVAEDQGARQEGDPGHGGGPHPRLRRAPGAAGPRLPRPTRCGSASWRPRSPTRRRPTSSGPSRTSSATWRRRGPMDRLICGDVGYGKTEVAIRAAFKAVQDGKQVAVLVPTTILAQQHLRHVPRAPRRLPGQGRDALALPHAEAAEGGRWPALAAGEVDIVIGTHRLLSKDVRFRDLGLVVIDEEHRFGVAHKERLRQLTHARWTC